MSDPVAVPDVPSNLSAPDSTDGNLSISRSAVGDSEYYNLQMQLVNGELTDYVTNDNNSAYFSTQLVSGRYYFRVKACNRLQECSAFSEPIQVLVTLNGPFPKNQRYLM
ncbi:fibronectin type III domain-containing protein [Aliikangiella maris]|uniref:Fibronectin type III domain-containing protein n=2 Tax=Aliikangiella maris TaxID=3162458 RepID=A0ABV3MLN5_9GAMM